MLSRLVRELRVHDDDNASQPTARRKSARLNNQLDDGDKEDDVLHDSGTESDEEEMESIARYRAEHGTDPFATWKSYQQFLAGGSPPALSADPPLPRDVDTESWDSFGRESGIMTGDNDSESDGTTTPTPRRRMRDNTIKQQDATELGLASTAEKRRYSMIERREEDQPIATRLRSGNASSAFIEAGRQVKVAARRIPVRVIINRPPGSTKTALAPPVSDEAAVVDGNGCALVIAPAAKRNRRNSHRPSLDFDKMVENRIEESPASVTTRSSPKKDAIVTRSQVNN